MATVLFDEFHGQRSRTGDGGGEGLLELTRALIASGLHIIPLDRPLSRLEDAPDVIVVPYPTKRFSPDEIERLVHWHAEGCGLVLLGEWGNLRGSADILTSISSHFGVRFNADRVTDPEHSYTEELRVMDGVVGQKKIPQFLLFDEIKHAGLARGVSKILIPSACSLEHGSAAPVIVSHPQSFSDLNANGVRDMMERTGRFTVAAALEDRGRVFFMGDTSLFTNKYIRFFDNMTFATNVISWAVCSHQ